MLRPEVSQTGTALLPGWARSTPGHRSAALGVAVAVAIGGPVWAADTSANRISLISHIETREWTPPCDGGYRRAMGVAQTTQPTITFQQTTAFLDELRARGPNVEPVVRVAKSMTQDRLRLGEGEPVAAPSWSVFVEATYLRYVRYKPEVLALVKLREFVGQEWHTIDGVVKDEHYRELQVRLNGVLDAIAEACRDRNLEIADGSSYQLPESDK